MGTDTLPLASLACTALHHCCCGRPVLCSPTLLIYYGVISCCLKALSEVFDHAESAGASHFLSTGRTWQPGQRTQLLGRLLL